MTGLVERLTVKRKCGCEYISERDPAVRKGYELGGYLYKACPVHAAPAMPDPTPKLVLGWKDNGEYGLHVESTEPPPDPTPRVIEGEPVATIAETGEVFVNEDSPLKAIFDNMTEDAPGALKTVNVYLASHSVEALIVENARLLSELENWISWAEGLSPAEISNGHSNLAKRLKSTEAENAALKAALEQAANDLLNGAYSAFVADRISGVIQSTTVRAALQKDASNSD